MQVPRLRRSMIPLRKLRNAAVVKQVYRYTQNEAFNYCNGTAVDHPRSLATLHPLVATTDSSHCMYGPQTCPVNCSIEVDYLVV